MKRFDERKTDFINATKRLKEALQKEEDDITIIFLNLRNCLNLLNINSEKDTITKKSNVSFIFNN